MKKQFVVGLLVTLECDDDDWQEACVETQRSLDVDAESALAAHLESQMGEALEHWDTLATHAITLDMNVDIRYVDSPNSEESAYIYRNLPMTSCGYHICGTDNADGGGCGILEWCTGKQDAEVMLVKMSQHHQFSGLEIGREPK